MQLHNINEVSCTVNTTLCCSYSVYCSLFVMMLVVYYIITMILIKELVMATDQCSKYRFKSPFYPGDSCEMIYSSNPESHNRSGYYWITVGPTRVYCGMAYTGSSCVEIILKLVTSQDIIVLMTLNGHIVT